MKTLSTQIFALTALVASTACCIADDRFQLSPILTMPAPTLGESTLVMPGHCPTFEIEPVYAVPALHNAIWDSQRDPAKLTTVTNRVTATSVSKPVAEIDYVDEVLSDIPQAAPLTAGSAAVPQTSPFSLFGIVVLVLGVFVWVVNLRR